MLPRLIRGLCRTCQVIEVDAEDATLEIHGPIREGTCRFACPVCSEELAKSVPPPLVEILLEVGVPSIELDDAAVAPPPLNREDLVRFRGQLEAYAGRVNPLPR
jgi:hypothetical protein